MPVKKKAVKARKKTARKTTTTRSKKTVSKAAGKSPAAARKAARKTAPSRKPSDSARPAFPREKMIEEAAYYIAEKQGFRGDPFHNWLQAEAQIDGNA